MPLLRASPILRSVAARCSPCITTRSPIAIQHRLFAQQSYGGADDDPKGGDPQNQGSNPSADKEHPGPAPPAEGQGTGGGPTKANKWGHNTQQNESSSGDGDVSSRGKESSSAQPKIHSSKVPEEHEHSDEVKQHNDEMDNRQLGGAQNKQDDSKQNVHKGYWSGQGGADSEP